MRRQGGKRIRAAIFDLDGTILYTLDSIAEAGNHMLRDLGYEERPLSEYRYYCGDGAFNLVKRALGVASGLLPAELTEDPETDWVRVTGEVTLPADLLMRADRLNRAYLRETSVRGVRPYEGVPEALSALKDSGVSLAVFSNKPHESAVTAVKGIYGDLFDCVRGQMEGVPIKPDPAGAKLVAEALEAEAEECLYFGDTWTDMRTGRSAGMYTVGVLWGYRDREELMRSGADALISSPGEIREMPDRAAAAHRL